MAIKTKFSKAIDTGKAFKEGADMSNREKAILKDIVSKTGFDPKKNIWRSRYYGTNQIGASHWLGKFAGKQVVLKIQGVKPEISEIYMIEEFAKQNRSKFIRPPSLYQTLPWDDKVGYEAFIMEYIDGGKILESKRLQTRENIEIFFKYYLEYRKNCLPKIPWLPKPEKKPNPKEELEKAYSISEEAHPNHPFRKESDKKLVEKAVNGLTKLYENVDLEFIHGHFSFYDLLYENTKSKVAVLFSNLFWKWRIPFFDSVFAYHWFMYELEHVKNITEGEVDEQRKLWMDVLFRLPIFQTSQNKRLLRGALIYLAVAGIVMDGFLMDKSRPIAKYLFDSVRNEATELISELK